MTSEADAVVIGAGAFGASVAYHLARLGKRVTVVDRFGTVSQTSPRAAGMATVSKFDDATSRLARRSVEQLLQFEDDTGQQLQCHQVGGLKMARTATYAEHLAEEVRRNRSRGLDIELIDSAEARRRAPYVDTSRATAIMWTPLDLYLEPGDLPRAYLQAATALGVEVRGRSAVTAIEVRHGEVKGVDTDSGSIDTPVVVNAAGAWAVQVGEMAGLAVPVVPVRHQLYITEPIESVSADMPLARVVDAQVYTRPERGGLMFGGYEPDPLIVDPRSLSMGMADLPLDIDPLRKLTRDVLGEYPVLDGAPLAELRGGLPTMTPDGQHIFSDSAIRGFFVMTGCLVGGLSVSPAAGESMAHWISTGNQPFDMSPFSLSRFGPGVEDHQFLVDAALSHYSRTYIAPDRRG